MCVLAGHMLPLGPKSLQMNAAIATTGMSLFFVLSGFLIVSMLKRNDNVASFLVRRICRIVPLAWAFLAFVLLIHGAEWEAWTANLLFYANLPPFRLDYGNSHFWSLSVEMQFYAAASLIVGMAGRRGLMLVPVFLAAVMLLRILYGAEISIVTWFRVDEILAGGCLALACSSPTIMKRVADLPALTPLFLAVLLLVSSHPEAGPMNYLRPYFAALLIGSTIPAADNVLQQVLKSRVLGYLAQISFALYVIHPLTTAGWLGSGDVGIRYTKRIGSFALTFFFAHFSTFYYEKYWINLGHRIAGQLDQKRLAPAG